MSMMRAWARRGEPVRHWATTVAQVQPEGVSLLADILENRHEPDTMRVAASYALSQVSNGDANIDAALRFALDDPARDARTYASRALVQKGDVKQALSVFINSMDEYDYWRTNSGPTESLKTLIAVSPPLIASILNSGKLSNSELVDLIKSIGECAKGDAVLLEPLLAKLDDKKENVRAAAAEALGHFPSGVDRIRPKLTAGLTDPAADVRIECARSLDRLGINTEEIGPLYEKVVNDYFVENGLAGFRRDFAWIIGTPEYLAQDVSSSRRFRLARENGASRSRRQPTSRQVSLGEG
jgi:HEAT repeat protein